MSSIATSPGLNAGVAQGLPKGSYVVHFWVCYCFCVKNYNILATKKGLGRDNVKSDESNGKIHGHCEGLAIEVLQKLKRGADAPHGPTLQLASLAAECVAHVQP